MASKIILQEGQVFNFLTVLKKSDKKDGDIHTYWDCVCKCGALARATGSDLSSGKAKSCGCLRKSRSDARKADMIGKVFGRLTVLREGTRQGNQVMWDCQCECGATKAVQDAHLIAGRTQSCGCYRESVRGIANTTHGHWKGGKASPTWASWSCMRNRCYYPGDTAYSSYGGKGVKMCERWLSSFENFLEDMGERPGKEFSLDRINPNGDYSPENCRWITKEAQARTKRNTLIIEVDGKRLKGTGLAAKALGVTPGGLKCNIFLGKSQIQGKDFKVLGRLKDMWVEV